MKVYTKTGDKGQTSLIGGKRVSKGHERLNVYGTIDELNSFLGLLRAMLKEENHTQLANDIFHIQNLLFNIGANLATEQESPQEAFSSNETLLLEQRIDQMESQLPPLKHFIIYGEDKLSAQAHVCRAVCRRAERKVVNLSENYTFDLNIIHYLNRLSDYLFVFARFVSKMSTETENIWLK